ncbi:DUF1853 family protein [Halomonas sp. NO4]|uniref:DUF1853 family protein n=1 Tax=Halomonas sp. NO4 TaxID=2484813 RepID=UPI0013D472E9|nr:DUF1853 family protein [Halomonas sp. NO4]
MRDTATSLLDRWHHPLVRDLAWLLACPDLVDGSWPPRPGRDDLGLSDPAHLDAWLADLEGNPAALEACVGDTLAGRMGLYHERLWQFLLAHSPGTRLLAHNLRVHREKQTLGELDLLYCRDDRAIPIHLEVAIKFYLGLPEGPGEAADPARWIGPGGADSLACKLAHLRDHQLPLSSRAEAREVIREALADRLPGPLMTITRRLALPGVLFQPWRAPLPTPRGSAATHWQGRWLRWSEWRDFRDGLPPSTRGAWLARPHWLALPRDPAFVALRTLEARLAQHFADPGSPVQVALATPAGRQRLFIVDDDWPRQIPLPPRQPPSQTRSPGGS